MSELVNPKAPPPEKSPSLARRRRAIEAFVALVLLGLAAIGVLAAAGPSWMAHGIVTAPNAGRTFRIADDPSPAELHDLGVDEQLRVEVLGACKRPVSLSVWIIEPKAEPLGT